MTVQTNATIFILTPLEKVFEVATSIKPSELIRPHGLLPGIAATDDESPWSKIGQTRRHTLSDSTSVIEKLAAFADRENFAYEVDGFSGLFGALAAGAKGEWHFTALAANESRIDWTYQFFPRSVLAEPLLWFIVKLLWPGYLRAALGRVKETAENEN